MDLQSLTLKALQAVHPNIRLAANEMGLSHISDTRLTKLVAPDATVDSSGRYVLEGVPLGTVEWYKTEPVNTYGLGSGGGGGGTTVDLSDIKSQISELQAASTKSARIDAEQQAALERLAAQAGTGPLMQIAYLTDVANITAGTTVDTLEIDYYSSASTKGGGLFKRVDKKTPVQTGIIVATKDGHKFQRVVEGGRYELEMFGYVPGGKNDSDVFFASIKAVAAVGGRLILPRNGALYIDASSTSAKFIPAGIKEIDGNGCTLYLINPINNEIWLSDDTGDLEIHHLTIRPGEGAARSGGIFGRGGSRVHIHHCDIFSKQNHNIVSRMLSMADGYQVERWEVHDNILDVDRGIDIAETGGSKGAYQNILFDIHQIDPNNTNNSMDSRWMAEKAVPNAGGRRHRNHKIYDNLCKGGRYGICLYFSEGSVVRDNRTENNARGIVLQDKCRGNKVYNNQIYDYTTGILLAYEPELNEVYNNTLYRRASWEFNGSGQGHIMCYVQPIKNTIRNNKCFCDDDGSPTWGIYVGVNATGNIVEGNEIYGKVGRSVIVLESSWGGTADNKITYSLANPNWSTMDSIGNIIRNNIIEVSVRVPGIVLCSRNDDTVVRKLTGTIISSNQFGAASDNSQYIRLITQDAAGISGTIGYLNTYPPTSTASNFIMGAAANWAKLSPEVNRAPVAFES